MVIGVDPDQWQSMGLNTVQVFSDAPDNDLALREVEQWASDHGFVRTTEYWLQRRLRPDGRWVFVGVCLRRTPDLAATGQAILTDFDRRAARVEQAG